MKLIIAAKADGDDEYPIHKLLKALIAAIAESLEEEILKKSPNNDETITLLENFKNNFTLNGRDEALNKEQNERLNEIGAHCVKKFVKFVIDYSKKHETDREFANFGNLKMFSITASLKPLAERIYFKRINDDEMVMNFYRGE